MSTVNTNIADYLTQIETLTSTNLQILKALNDSFYSKKNHIFAEVDEATYAIPSFLSLENKINMLQENFENLVKSPETGEAYFNFNGNTRAIEVRKYSYTPNSLTLPCISEFSIENNDIFKDFMTPVPYVKIGLDGIPNDITEVNVKKIIARSDALKDIFATYFSNDNPGASISRPYSDIHRLIENYTEDVDYIEYDTIYKLPIHKSIGSGTYVIESVVSDVIDDDLNEIITLKLRNDLLDNALYRNNLTYKLFDELIEKPLNIGDELINYDGTGKVVITEVKPSSNTIVVKVVNGEYLNFIGTTAYDADNDSDIHDLSKLRFYSPANFDDDKYVKIPLEEDKYVFIAVAPLNSRMNVQSSWGSGLLFNTFNLKNNDKYFNEYYKENVKNIGDVLFEMTSMITSPISKLTREELDSYMTYKPELTDDSFKVVHINSHLDNSDTVINIRNAYAQKRQAEIELDNVQKNISQINDQLSSISFADTTGMREIYTAQLVSLNDQKNNIVADINNAINIISMSVNNSDIPLENPKYRIRGFYVPKFEDDVKSENNVIGINLQYRYKNISTDVSVPLSMKGSDGKTDCTFSDWIELNTRLRRKIVSYDDNDNLKYDYEDDNHNSNNPSYNQVDIPISQGESVDIRLKLIYSFGQPYVNVESEWSDEINIAFPSDFTKNTPILTIIEENNNDVETNRFNDILANSGITTHINDSIVDQNITYYHRPDNIASGFYTAERRIIPLKDKLESLSNDIALLRTEILGGEGGLLVSAGVGSAISQLYSDRTNSIILTDYETIAGSEGDTNGDYINNENSVSTYVNIYISNTGTTTLKLYPLFPGKREDVLNSLNKSKFDISDYTTNGNAIHLKYNAINDEYDNYEASKPQGCNQFITFRIKDAWTGEPVYNGGYSTLPSLNNTKKIILYPHINTEYGLCIDSDDNRSCLVVNPGEEIVIPIYCEFNGTGNESMSFDLRTSLYTDPINYTFTVISKASNSAADKLAIVNKRRLFDRLKNLSKYNTTIK